MPPSLLARSLLSVLSLAALLAAPSAPAQPVDPRLYAELRWRMIGPHRGGRTVAGVGVPGQPNVFYIGVNNGGVWRTTDSGRVWTPIFDDQPTGSIGALAVAPSNPNVLYVGSGEALQRPDLSTGDGLYKSTDAGKTWTHLGLRDGQQIAAIAVDPRTADRLFVAVLGHPYGPNAERGVYRSLDGGKTLEKVLYKDEDTGAMDVAIDPSDPRTVYAVLYAARQGPWEIHGSWVLSKNNGLFKSTDGGTTWRPLTKGLPDAEAGLGRIGIEVSRANPRRLYAVLGAHKGGGVYRSDDAGESWALINTDERLWGRDGDFNEIRADPKNPDIVYVANVVTWRSTDGGKTFSAFRGAPGGDDYHRLWINPDDPRIVLLTSDQGAVVTVNGGQTWSSWYNQPTAQLFHVNTDNAFPYRVCGGQQESGSVCIQSRGEYGEITFREWYPVGVEEYGYAVPDPLNPDIVYGGKLSRFDRRTRETRNVAPRLGRGEDFRVIRTQPVAFSPADPRVLYFASNVVWRTADGGQSWTRISPDLSRETYAVPESVGAFAPVVRETGKRRGVVYALAPSPKEVNRLWAGTDDGLIHLTTDGGKRWQDVTPPELRARPWAKVSILEASHFDPAVAYAAINTFRLDDLRPYIYRTRDGGKTWARITEGIPDGGIVNVVREDPRRRGLLYAGTERQVFVSFDDGDHWQSLRMNMPATSIRDLVVKDDDLVVATHGRSFWILDDVTPLRQLAPTTAREPALLFEPQVAYRVRWNRNTDTPLPPDEPAGQNPPDGAILDYYLGTPPRMPVTLEILDAAGKLVRRYSSADLLPPLADEGNTPAYWIRPSQELSTAPGMHRFVWDLRYPAPPALDGEFPISAIPQDTPREPRGPWVLPGRYTVRLTVDGHSWTQPLTVQMDPRVKVPAAALARQLALSLEISEALRANAEALQQVQAARARLKAAAARAPEPLSRAVAELDPKLAALAGEVRAHELRDDSGADDFARLGGAIGPLYEAAQEADVAPPQQLASAFAERRRALDQLLARWAQLRAGELAALEARLREAGVPLQAP